VKRSPGGVLHGVSPGEYDASWQSLGSRHYATLVVSRDGGSLGVARSVPLSVVRVAGPLDSIARDLDSGSFLVERSARSCMVPRSIHDLAMFELTAGRGLTSSFHDGEADESGEVVFDAVAPGDYELVHPGWEPQCIRVEQASGPGVKRVTSRPRSARGSIGGTVRSGSLTGSFDVEIRMLGPFRARRSVSIGETFEFDGLAQGTYSVRAITPHIQRYAIRGQRVPASSWKNIHLAENQRCTLDFTVE
jgi:hypothetical protein